MFENIARRELRVQLDQLLAKTEALGHRTDLDADTRRDLHRATGDFKSALHHLNQPALDLSDLEEGRLMLVRAVISLGLLWIERVERDLEPRRGGMQRT